MRFATPLGRRASGPALFLFVALGAASPARAQYVAVGSNSASVTGCFIAAGTGGVKCWGTNYFGELGNGTSQTPSYTPTSVLASSGGGPLQGTTSVAIGIGTVCVSLNSGQARCWGSGTGGTLGNGSAGSNSAATALYPTAVMASAASPTTSLTGVKEVSLNTSSTACALMQDTGVKCWGSGTTGQLGNGGTASSTYPVDVRASASDASRLLGVRKVSMGRGNAACALMETGGVKCWGYKNYGQLGNGETANSASPAPVDVLASAGGPALSGVTDLFVGTSYACAVVTGGGVKCWGLGTGGQLGNGGVVSSNVPVSVWTGNGNSTPLSGVRSLSGGYDHVCAAMENGGMVCWGKNTYGQFGNGATSGTAVPYPVAVTAPAGAQTPGYTVVAAGVYSTCGLYNGALYCWGQGPVGNGTGAGNTTLPAAVSTSDAVLPVELVAFTAAADGPSARLAWTTAGETNNAGFVVERRTGGTWTDASALIAGRGTTAERRDYAHAVTGLTAGRHTFRLRQIDADGTVHFSGAVTVEIGVADDLRLTALGGRALRVESAAGAEVAVFDVLGRRVHRARVSAGTTVLDVRGVGAGVYVVRAADDGGAVRSGRIVVR